MNRQSIRDYILRQQQRYHKANRTEKGRILDEVVAVTGYHRKSAVRLLSGRSRGGGGARVGRPVEYGPKVAAAVRLIHEAAGGIGAKRLHPFVGDLAARLVRFRELKMDAETEALLRRASASTLERLLAADQVPVRRKVRSLTKPGTTLRNRIAVRTIRDWDDARPGFVEVDTVAHCGATTEGFHLWTVTAVDVATGWVEMDVVWGKTQERVGAAIRRVHRRLPVPRAGSGQRQRYGVHKSRAVQVLRGAWDHVHQEQTVPKERQRPRGAEERSCGAAADRSRTVLVLGSLQAVEAGLFARQAPRELLSASPTAHREKS